MEQSLNLIAEALQGLPAPLQDRIVQRHRTVAQLKTVLIESLELSLDSDEIDEDEPLFGYGLGLDSIDALQLVLGVENAFDLSLPPDDLMIYRSINTIADYIIDRTGKENGDDSSGPGESDA